MRRLWGEIKPRPAVVDAIAGAAAVTDPAVAARALLVFAPAPLSGRVTGMSTFLERHLALDMPRIDRDVEERLFRLADDPDIDIRAIALASLHYARGTDGRARSQLAARL